MGLGADGDPEYINASSGRMINFKTDVGLLWTSTEDRGEKMIACRWRSICSGLQALIGPFLVTSPETTTTGPGFNRGSRGGAQGRGFEKRVGAYARTEGGRFL